MQLNPEKLQQLAFLNPGPIERAMDLAVAEAAGQPVQGQADYASVFGGLPASGGLAAGSPTAAPAPKAAPSMGPNPQQMQQLMAQMNPQAPKQQFAPGAAPQPAPKLGGYPNYPDITKILGGRRA